MCIAVLSFTGDIMQFFLLGHVVAPLLLCMYCALLFYDLRRGSLGFIAFLQCLEFFCFYTNFLLPLTYILPLAGIAFYCKKNLYPSFAHVIAFIAISTIMEHYLIKGLFLGLWPTCAFTIMRISAMLLITICYSLTINIWGMQDNRAWALAHVRKVRTRI